MNLLQLHEPGETPLPHADEQGVAIGIDLGTTHSVAAVSRGGTVEILQDAGGKALIPSVVEYSPGMDAVRVGHEARAAHAAGSALTVASIKREMGRSARITHGGREISPVEISAEILKHMRALAENALLQPVTRAVITVPAYFDDAARAATKDAARLAGLEVLRLVSEPTAAALAYGLDKDAEGIYAVYDLGGGTFDVSLLRLEKGVFQVLATAGDTQLGGDDFDRAIAEHLKLGESGEALAKARNLKEALSAEDSAGDLRRAELEPLLAPYVSRTLALCAGALADAGLTREEVKGVVLVGGSTRIPHVRAKVEEFFGKPPLTDINPDEVVAAGAALQAEALTAGSDTLLLDVVPLSLGLETMGGLMEKLIPRNTPIPVAVSQEFTTWQDGQGGMQVHVYQGEREMAAQNRSLARFDLSGIPPLPAGVARVHIDFAVDADGLLTVSAREQTTGAAQTVHVKPSYGLPPEEIERMLRESMEHAREDITERLLAEAKMEAERAIVELESALNADGEALLTPPERTLIEQQAAYLREAISEGDRDRIDVELQQLAKIASPFAERRMNRAVGKMLHGKKIEDISNG